MHYNHFYKYYQNIFLYNLIEKFPGHLFLNKLSYNLICDKFVFSFNKSISSKNFLSNQSVSDVNSDIRMILNCLLFEQISFQKYKYTKSKNSIASFYIKKNMKLGFKLTLRRLKAFDFLVSFFIFTYVNQLYFRGFYINPLLLSESFSFGVSELSNFSSIDYDFYDWTSFYLFEKNGFNISIYSNFMNIFIVNFFLSHFESSFF